MLVKFIRRMILILLMVFFFDIDDCFAQGKYINAKFSNNEDNLFLDISILDNDIYGILLSFDYNSYNLKFNKCSSENFVFYVENNRLLLEDTVGHKNINAVNCEFQILKNNVDIYLGIRDISLSNGENVLYEEDIIFNLEHTDEKENDVVIDNSSSEDGNISHNPITSGKKILLFVGVAVILLLVLNFIVYKYKIFVFIILFLFIKNA